MVEKPIFLLLLLTFLLEFWQLGQHPVNAFDEARFGANAYEMMHNGDYFNLHYQGQPDAWVARPPLKAWLIIVGYKLFGNNEWGLRFSSGIGILIFLFFTFKWLHLYFSSVRASFACLLLLSVKGIIGFHVGRNGDMDAELLAFLAGFLYYFLSYLHFNNPKALLAAAVFLSLAFWLKTVAAFYYLPGILLYLVLSRKWLSLYKDKYFWIAAAILLLLILSWVMGVVVWGTRYENTQYAGNNAIETMLVYDVWMRFTATQFDHHPVFPTYDFFLTNLDSRFNVWNYFFYGGLGLYLFYRIKKVKLSSAYEKLLPLFACILLPVFALLTFGMHKLDWYSAPLFPILLIFVLFLIDQIVSKFAWFKWLLLATLVFTLARHALYIREEKHLKNEASFFTEQWKSIAHPDTLFVIGDVPQNVYLNMLWVAQKVVVVPTLSAFKVHPNRVGVTFRGPKEDQNGLIILSRYEDERLNVFYDIVTSTPKNETL